MLLTLIMILLLVGAAVVGSMYSGFLIFHSNFEDSTNYHKAYYASVGALERAELAIRHRQPGYEGSAGWIEGVSTGTYKSGNDRIIGSGFGYLNSGNIQKSNLFWQISSRTSRIPNTGQGNVERMLSDNDSENYNTMGYENAEIFLLYVDSYSNAKNPYTGNTTLTNINPNKITGKIRLPKALSGSLGSLDTHHALNQGDPWPNDAIVDWQIRGKYNNNNFTVYSTQDKITNPNSISSEDSAIRETHINGIANLNFGTGTSPVSSSKTKSVTVISPDEADFSGKTFQNIFTMGTGKQLRLSLLNLLKTENGLTYPFLEYYIDAGTQISDRYYTILAEGKYGDFQVQLLIKKPTIQESVLGSFTVIF